MMKSNWDGLERIQQNAEKLNGTRQVQLKDLLTPQFMEQYTEFTSFEQMFEQSPFTVHSIDDFKAIPDEQWDAFIQMHTRFAT